MSVDKTYDFEAHDGAVGDSDPAAEVDVLRVVLVGEQAEGGVEDLEAGKRLET